MKKTLLIAIAVSGAALVSMSSLYIALKLGALPWPTVFAALAAYGVLRLFRQDDIKSANCVQAAVSAGGLVAGGIAFTLPALWMADSGAQISLATVCCLALGGALLGWYYSASLRRNMLQEQNLPFPMGQAAAEALQSGSTGEGAGVLFGSMAGAAVFTLLRDGAKLFEAALVMPLRNTVAGIWLSPMAAGVGYIIGPQLCGWWAAGVVAVTAWMMFDGSAAAAFMKDSAGIGLITGGGVGTVLVNLNLRRVSALNFSCDRKQLLIPLAWLLIVAGGVNWLAALVFVVISFVVCRIAAQLTGQTAINPMDLLGLMSALVVVLCVGIPLREMIMVAAVAAVASAVAGDTLQDLKSGMIIGTPYRSQLGYALSGAIIGAVTASVVLLNLHNTFGVFGEGSEFAAPQARAISAMLSGNFQQTAFYNAVAVGILAALLRVPAIFVGLGVYLPVVLSSTIITGGIINLFVRNSGKTANARAQQIAAGCLGGEGIAGVLYALWRSWYG